MAYFTTYLLHVSSVFYPRPHDEAQEDAEGDGEGDVDGGVVQEAGVGKDEVKVDGVRSRKEAGTKRCEMR